MSIYPITVPPASFFHELFKLEDSIASMKDALYSYTGRDRRQLRRRLAREEEALVCLRHFWTPAPEEGLTPSQQEDLWRVHSRAFLMIARFSHGHPEVPLERVLGPLQAIQRSEGGSEQVAA